MKTIALTFLVLATFFSSCKKDSGTKKGFYENMHFVRQGGGQIDFKLYSTENANQIKVVVSKYDFRDTTIQIIIDNNPDYASAFSSFHNAISNKIQINGDFQHSTLATGTWSYIYFIAENKEIEVTNKGLRDTLLKFEQLVRNKIDSENSKADYEVSVNEQFHIDLVSNPTTGYSWAWVNKQTIDIVDTIDRSFMVDTPVLVGSGGKEIWKFKGVKSGVDSIKMEYCRPWDSNSTIDSKIIVVKVK